MQIYGVCKELLNDESAGTLTYGLIMGGANRKTEAERLRKGVNIIIATPGQPPGRLLDHLKNSPGFVTRNLLVFCMDEADRILEIGFEHDLRAFVKMLPAERQTMLFSATQTKEVEDLARLSTNAKTAVYVDVQSDTTEATTENLEQGYVTCPSDKRFLLLFTFRVGVSRTARGASGPPKRLDFCGTRTGFAGGWLGFWLHNPSSRRPRLFCPWQQEDQQEDGSRQGENVVGSWLQCIESVRKARKWGSKAILLLDQSYNSNILISLVASISKIS
jgi:hypothetical protein